MNCVPSRPNNSPSLHRGRARALVDRSRQTDAGDWLGDGSGRLRLTAPGGGPGTARKEKSGRKVRKKQNGKRRLFKMPTSFNCVTYVKCIHAIFTLF